MTAPSNPALAVGAVQARWEALQLRLESLGASDVKVLAVTKGFDEQAVRAACSVGLHAVGENYAQEMAAKADLLRHTDLNPEWHFVGGLQSNKIKLIADAVSVWQSVDRLKIANQIQRHAPGATVYVQMRPPGVADNKAGAAPDDVRDLVFAMRDLGLTVDGIMAVGVDNDEAGTRRAFEVAVELADELELRERSIGMSGDLELAVEAGSTMVRVGTGLFGPRPPR